MGKYEDALKVGLTDDDIVNNFKDKATQSIDAVGPDETAKFMKEKLELPDHIIGKLIGKEVPTAEVTPTQPTIPEDLSPEAKAAPVMPTTPAPEPSFLDKANDIIHRGVKEVKQVVSSMVEPGLPNLKQGAGALEGTAGEVIGWAGAGIAKAGGGQDNIVSDTANKMKAESADIQVEWEKAHGANFNVGKLLADVGTPMGPAMQALTKGKGFFGVAKELVSPANATSILSGMGVIKAQLDRDNIPNANIYAAGFGSLQAVFPVAGVYVNYKKMAGADNYMKEALGLKQAELDVVLAPLAKSHMLEGMNKFEQNVWAASTINPQAALIFQKTMLSSDDYASYFYKYLASKNEQVDNIVDAQQSDLHMAVADTQSFIKGEYKQMDNIITDTTSGMSFNIDKVKASIGNIAEDVEANLVGREKSLSTLGKINRSEPTTYEELVELTSDLGKVIRTKGIGESNAKAALESVYKNLRGSIEEQVTSFASVEGKQVIQQAIKEQNQAYAFLKEDLGKDPLFKGMLETNKKPGQEIAAIVNSVTQSTNSELTSKFINTLNRIKATTNPEMVEQSIVKNIIENSKTKVSEAGDKLIDFNKLSETLDSLPEGLITTAQTKAVINSLQDVAAFSKYDVQLGKSINAFGGKEAGELANKVSGMLGFSVGLKAQQFLAKSGLFLISDAAAYSTVVAKLLDKQKELPIVIAQFRNKFGYALPQGSINQLDKYMKQTESLYNEGTKVHNYEVSVPALSDTQATQYGRLSNLYSEGELKDMFNLTNTKNGIDNLPYAQINESISFRWDKLANTEQDIKDVSTHLAEVFPGKKIVLGDKTDFSGDVWTVNRQDQFTPGKLSKDILDILDAKTMGVKYNLSREIPDILGVGEKKILSNDLTYHLEKHGITDSNLELLDASESYYRFMAPNGTISLTRHNKGNGHFEWTAFTTSLEMGSGTGSKWYQGVFDFIESLGPKHRYSADTALSPINTLRANVNQLQATLRQGHTGTTNPSSSQVGMRHYKDTEGRNTIIPGTKDTFIDMANGTIKQIETLIGQEASFAGKSIGELTDKEINTIVSTWHNGFLGKEELRATLKGTSVEKDFKMSTGEKTLKMLRGLDKAIKDGTLTKGQAKAIADGAEDIANNLPKPLTPDL